MIVDEYGQACPTNAQERPSNAGIIIRGPNDAIEQTLLKLKELEVLGIQVVYIRRSWGWLTIIDGRPDVAGHPRDPARKL
jgi:hypothetical protein